MTSLTTTMRDVLRLIQGGKISAATATLRRKMRELTGYAQPREGSDVIFDSANPSVVTEAPHRNNDYARVGGSFTEIRYTCAAGSRRYKLFIPAHKPASRLPLVIMLHGCKQTPDDFALGTGMNALAAQQRCAVVYPEQALSANGSKCWNWFKSSDQERDRGEPALIAGITRQAIAAHGLDANRVYVAGLSAGGAMAVVMGQTYPDLFAAVGVHSGIPYALAHDAPSAFAAMNGSAAPSKNGTAPSSQLIPTIVLHGDQDKTVHSSNGEKLAAQFNSHAKLANSRLETERGERAGGGRAYTRTRLRNDIGKVIVEYWLVHGAGHAWFGGNPEGPHTDPTAPDASKEILRFLFEHELNAKS